MQELFHFLYRFRTFGLFLLLEGVCAWLIISYNNRQNAAFLNSSNSFVASINSITSYTSDYFRLRQINDQLASENLLLREKLANASLSRPASDSLEMADSAKYRLIKAQVINNTFRRSMNYITLNAGREEGITPGMGVISGTGVVGQVKSVSGHFSTIISLLHQKLLVSSKIRRTGTLCTVQWDGVSSEEAMLEYIPRHIQLHEGDSIVTSGFNTVFPAGILVGTISAFELTDNDVFYKAHINLAVDFSSLNYLYVIENALKNEQDSLQNLNMEEE